MAEDDRGAMLRALADEDTLRVFAQVVTATGTGLPQRSAGSIGYHYVTAHGMGCRAKRGWRSAPSSAPGGG